MLDLLLGHRQGETPFELFVIIEIGVHRATTREEAAGQKDEEILSYQGEATPGRSRAAQLGVREPGRQIL